MKKFFSLLFCLVFLSFMGFGQIDKILGDWKTIDDKDGTEKSIVHIFKATNGKYYGRIDKLFKEPEKLCTECTGTNKDKPILGMRIVNEMLLENDALTGGTILDPKNGKIYKCNISYNSKTGNLIVRGSLDKKGILGRSQTWIRVQ